MKKSYWRFVMALLVGTGFLLASGVNAALAGPAPQGRGQGQDDQGNGRDHGERDHGRGHGREHMNRGRWKKWERDHDGRYRFDDDDRGEVAVYFRDHHYRYERERAPEGLPVTYGYVISEQYRRYCHPVPVTLVEELPPPPEGYRYYMFGGNVVLLDNGYRVQDFIHVGINIGL